MDELLYQNNASPFIYIYCDNLLSREKYMRIIILIILIILLLVLYYYNKNTIWTNIIVFLTIKRGILSSDCFWWNISDLFTDTSGILTYQGFEKDKKLVPMNIFGTNLYIVTDINYIKQILDNSPNIFGVGSLKYDFFKSFMKDNVGVSNGQLWENRRILNEYVLSTNESSIYLNVFHKNINNIIKKNIIPTNYSQFLNIAKLITMKIVFNEDKIYEPLFEIFTQANSLNAIIFGSTKIDPNVLSNYNTYLKKHIKRPNIDSLVYIAKNNTSDYELMHQIPHWIFPITGIIAVTIPRLLLLLSKHSQIFKKVINEIKDNKKDIYKLIYLRKCILETLRLNNPVNSTFRKLLQDYKFENDGNNETIKKGTEFLILNNPVLRTPEIFTEPNKYVPERWNKELENSYYSLMFNQGPQKCPGKELAINIMKSFVVHYLYIANYTISSDMEINLDNIQQLINPCKINIKNNIEKNEKNINYKT